MPLICPTGFHRHPKFCDQFYQCTTSGTGGNDMKVLVLSCPNATLFDEEKIQCLPADQTTPCKGAMAGTRVRRLVDDSPPPIQITTKKELCPSEGLFPYEQDCLRFYRCKKSPKGHIRGYLYSCPTGFAFWDVSKRCERIGRIPQCKRGMAYDNRYTEAALAPTEMYNVGAR